MQWIRVNFFRQSESWLSLDYFDKLGDPSVKKSIYLLQKNYPPIVEGVLCNKNERLTLCKYHFVTNVLKL